MTDHTPLIGGRRHAAVGFVFVTAVIDVLALGVMIPVLPLLVKQMAGGDTANASDWNTVFMVSYGLIQFFAAPVIGLFSDRYGRRSVLLVSIFGLGVDFLFMALAPNLWWLWMGRMIAAFTAASYSTANAYVADITPPEGRAKAFGLMGAAFGVGFTFGPAAGGWLAEIDLRLPFYVCAGLALLNWLYGFFILPESLPLERRIKAIDWKRANPLGSLVLLKSHADLLGLAGVYFLYALAHMVLPAVFILYVSERYGWSPGFTGSTMVLTGIGGIIVQAFVTGPVVKKVGERGALLIGMATGAIGFLIYGLAPTGWIYLLGVPVFALMGLVQPGIQGLMSRRVTGSEQGQLQGANAAMMGLAGILGPLIFTQTFSFALRHEGVLNQPGLPILLAAAIMLVGFVIAWIVAKPPPAQEPQQA